MAFETESWQGSVRRGRTPLHRRAIYQVARPGLSAFARRYLTPTFLNETRPDRVLFSRGFPLEHRRAWAAKRIDVRASTILIQGTGTGWDTVAWARMRPKRLIATDLYPFEESWDEIANACRRDFGVEVEFHKASLEHLAFLASGEVDLCVSNAVLEHCRDLPAVMQESARVVRPGGFVYAGYGPLWFSPGGDHFSGRTTLREFYNHVLLPDAEYRAFFEAHRYPAENFQSGGRYVELDLFSRLTSREYLGIYAECGFERAGLIHELSWDAVRFERQYPDVFQALLDRHADRIGRDDLRLRADMVCLQRL